MRGLKEFRGENDIALPPPKKVRFEGKIFFYCQNFILEGFGITDLQF